MGNGLKKVTDPKLLNQLESSSSKKVTDPSILKQLEPDTGFSGTNMVKNIPSSAVKFAKDVTFPVRHPIQFSRGVNALSRGLGGTQPLGGASFANQDRIIPPTEAESQAVQGVGEFYKDRYGSKDAILNTIENDPVGAGFDALGIKGLLKAGGKSAKMAAGTAVPKSLPENLMKSSVKFSTTGGRVKRQNQIRTMLDEKILPNDKGYQKIASTIDELNDGVDLLLDASTASGKTFSKDALFKHLGKLRRDLGGVKLDANRDLTSINNYTRQFEKHLKKIKRDKITPKELQELKKSAYKEINWDMKQGKASFAVNETRRKIAQASRELIEESAPGVKALNKREGRLLDLQSDFERALHRIENRDVGGIGTPMKVVAAESLQPGSGVIGLGMGLLDSPSIKARTALGLENLRTAQGLGLHPEMVALQGLLQSGRLQSAEDSKPK